MLLLAPLHEAGTEVISQEGEKETSEEYGGGRSLILKLAQAFVTEHELGVGEEMDESSREHDTGTELLQNNEDDIRLGDDVEASRQNRQEDTETASDQDDEEKTDAQRDVVVAGCCITRHLAFAAAYAVSVCN